MSAPFEPSADARAFAAIMRNHYLALVQEGFTETQALQIVGVMLASAIGGNK